jgi:hypothetical protein
MEHFPLLCHGTFSSRKNRGKLLSSLPWNQPILLKKGTGEHFSLLCHGTNLLLKKEHLGMCVCVLAFSLLHFFFDFELFFVLFLFLFCLWRKERRARTFRPTFAPFRPSALKTDNLGTPKNPKP